MHTESKSTKLNELQAMAICGNDISSSCLYVSALTILYAGQFAWISLLVVAGVLFLFQRIYGEVVGALPLNGGAYNALLNTTSKQMASVAACLTILSYMATAVISANEAMHYLHNLIPMLPLSIATIALLAIFMGLALYGIGESAIVAVVIFITHLAALSLLVIVGSFYLLTHGIEVFQANWQLPVASGGIMTALFLGFSAAMLGISGFESSANFVEEQAAGVFRKTLRNMWMVVSFFNPAITLLALCIIPLAQVGAHKESLLAFLGETAGGRWLGLIISVDAVLVLSGAVLTSFVGVTGLIERITLDRILPNFFLVRNKRGVNYRIVIGFFILCVSVLFATQGDLGALAGVYTFSFLAVMALFGLGNLLLKIKRAKLPRPVKAHPMAVLIAVVCVSAAFWGNALLNPSSLFVFFQYLVPSLGFIFLMLNRGRILRILLYSIDYLYRPVRHYVLQSSLYLRKMLHKINSQEFVFFTKGDDVAVLNTVLQYVQNNEKTGRLKIVTVMNPGQAFNEPLRHDLEVLDRAYPEVKIEYLELVGTFGPELIEEYSKKWDIPKNFMFIGSPGDRFPYRLSELGGVRLII
ncbi:MAG TPA: APC family permease [Haliscomenobacter sp.]|uniref:APC family permease n=1 Tax=Haliscomenobacter sp. TaxID=2717303 RepID=UPI002B767786|nr:APC family permease [Haliscomenobacter sp.]HOY21475.1 APC family permease [Haliscomenobacter sp.]